MSYLYAEYVGMPFYSTEEKEEYIKDTSEEAISEDEEYIDHIIYTCPHCKKTYTDLDEALTCCYDDCDEQFSEWISQRDTFTEHWA